LANFALRELLNPALILDTHQFTLLGPTSFADWVLIGAGCFLCFILLMALILYYIEMPTLPCHIYCDRFTHPQEVSRVRNYARNMARLPPTGFCLRRPKAQQQTARVRTFLLFDPDPKLIQAEF
jgi:hypothetical protein